MQVKYFQLPKLKIHSDYCSHIYISDACGCTVKSCSITSVTKRTRTKMLKDKFVFSSVTTSDISKMGVDGKLNSLIVDFLAGSNQTVVIIDPDDLMPIDFNVLSSFAIKTNLSLVPSERRNLQLFSNSLKHDNFSFSFTYAKTNSEIKQAALDIKHRSKCNVLVLVFLKIPELPVLSLFAKQTQTRLVNIPDAAEDNEVFEPVLVPSYDYISDILDKFKNDQQELLKSERFTNMILNADQAQTKNLEYQKMKQQLDVIEAEIENLSLKSNCQALKENCIPCKEQTQNRIELQKKANAILQKTQALKAKYLVSESILFQKEGLL